MIQDEKDRLEILRIAVSLTTPKASGMPADKIAQTVIDLAAKLQEFVKGKTDGNDR